MDIFYETKRVIHKQVGQIYTLVEEDDDSISHAESSEKSIDLDPRKLGSQG